ncbi:hypothetical protein DL96DRAFT_1596507 [Flagelloscypha sp. PMI_526]|nr:hypothetical protein DL96DRAFT_1596507 [Flagelloscypha sp. PMI_526]
MSVEILKRRRSNSDTLHSLSKRQKQSPAISVVGPEDDPATENFTLSSPEHSKNHLLFSQRGSWWRGPKALRRLAVFGDSYSYTGEDTWTAMFPVHEYSGISLWNYSKAGATAAEDLDVQVGRFLLLWLGINDCGSMDEGDLDDVVEHLFDQVHRLYTNSNIRNLLFVDVPPIECSPGGRPHYGELSSRVHRWNELLKEQVEDFASSSRHASVYLFSSHSLLLPLLRTTDGRPRDHLNGGEIWADDLHLTSVLHRIIAESGLGLFKLLE